VHVIALVRNDVSIVRYFPVFAEVGGELLEADDLLGAIWIVLDVLEATSWMYTKSENPARGKAGFSLAGQGIGGDGGRLGSRLD
jgi:hypothetical protein